MNTYYISVQSATYAQKLTLEFHAERVRAKTIKAPAEFKARGCGYALVVAAGYDTVLRVLRRQGTRDMRLYQIVNGEAFREIYY